MWLWFSCVFNGYFSHNGYPILEKCFLYGVCLFQIASLFLFLFSSNFLYQWRERQYAYFCLLLFFLDIVWLFSITASLLHVNPSTFWLVSLSVLSSSIKGSTLLCFSQNNSLNWSLNLSVAKQNTSSCLSQCVFVFVCIRPLNKSNTSKILLGETY